MGRGGPAHLPPASRLHRKTAVEASLLPSPSSSNLPTCASRDATSISAHPIFCGGPSDNNQDSVLRETSISSTLRQRIDRSLGRERERAPATLATNNFRVTKGSQNSLVTGTEQTPNGKKQRTSATSHTYCTQKTEAAALYPVGIPHITDYARRKESEPQPGF